MSETPYVIAELVNEISRERSAANNRQRSYLQIGSTIVGVWQPKLSALLSELNAPLSPIKVAFSTLSEIIYEHQSPIGLTYDVAGIRGCQRLFVKASNYMSAEIGISGLKDTVSIDGGTTFPVGQITDAIARLLRLAIPEE